MQEIWIYNQVMMILINVILISKTLRIFQITSNSIRIICLMIYLVIGIQINMNYVNNPHNKINYNIQIL